jgi:hypothetical protein
MLRDYKAALQRPTGGSSDAGGSDNSCRVKLNPYGPTPEEILPEGYGRNSKGYLIRRSPAGPLAAFDA